MKDMKWLYNMVITFFAAGCLTSMKTQLIKVPKKEHLNVVLAV